MRVAAATRIRQYSAGMVSTSAPAPPGNAGPQKADAAIRKEAARSAKASGVCPGPADMTPDHPRGVGQVLLAPRDPHRGAAQIDPLVHLEWHQDRLRQHRRLPHRALGYEDAVSPERDKADIFRELLDLVRLIANALDRLHPDRATFLIDMRAGTDDETGPGERKVIGLVEPKWWRRAAASPGNPSRS